MNGDGRPIGVFDSGVGGLAVLRELRRLLPAEDFVYFADQANFPYGPRSPEELRLLSLAAADRLVAEGAKLIVVACNTASSAALPALRARFDTPPVLPIVGVEPALKPACALTRTGRVGVLATNGTVQGRALDDLARRVAGDVQVTRIAAPALVELVERDCGADERERVVRETVQPLAASGADVVVLGCTHFAFIRPEIERALGPGVTVIEPAAAVARQTARVLSDRGLAAPVSRHGSVRFISSMDADWLAAMAARMLAGFSAGDSGGASAPAFKASGDAAWPEVRVWR